LTHTSRYEDDDQDGNHDRRTSFALRGVVEYLDHRLVCRSVEHAFKVAEAEDVSDTDDQQHNCITCDGVHDDSRDGQGSILDLLGHVNGAVVALSIISLRGISMPIIGTIPIVEDRPTLPHPPLSVKLKMVSCTFPRGAMIHNGMITTKTPRQ